MIKFKGTLSKNCHSSDFFRLLHKLQKASALAKNNFADGRRNYKIVQPTLKARPNRIETLKNAPRYFIEVIAVMGSAINIERVVKYDWWNKNECVLCVCAESKLIFQWGLKALRFFLST